MNFQNISKRSILGNSSEYFQIRISFVFISIFALKGFLYFTRQIFSPRLSLKCALRESGCRIGYEPTKMNRDHFWRSIPRDTSLFPGFLHCPDTSKNGVIQQSRVNDGHEAVVATRQSASYAWLPD